MRTAVLSFVVYVAASLQNVDFVAFDNGQALLLEAFIAGLFDDMADEAERERFATVARAKLEALG